MALVIRQLASSRFAIDDGTHLLDACPCCGVPLNTEASASALLGAIETGGISIDAAVTLVAAWKKVTGEAS